MGFLQSVRNGFSNKYFNEAMENSRLMVDRSIVKLKPMTLREVLDALALFFSFVAAVMFITVFSLTTEFQLTIFVLVCATTVLLCLARFVTEKKMVRIVSSFLAWRNKVRDKVDRW